MKTTELKPINNATRHTILQNKNLLIKNNKMFKSINFAFQKAYGRETTTGHITAWHKQRGAKSLYKKQVTNKKEIKSVIIGINYNPNTSGLASLGFNLVTKKFFNDLHIKNTYPGSFITRTKDTNELRNGYRAKIKNIPAGTLLSNISFPDKNHGQYAKSAGTFGQLIQKDFTIAKVKLPSNKIIQIPVTGFATIGVISNEFYRNVVIGKAGRNRNLGRRPIVRGIAMNPVDHPHGGRTNGGQPSSTPWGLPTKSGFKLKKRSYKLKS